MVARSAHQDPVACVFLEPQSQFHKTMVMSYVAYAYVYSCTRCSETRTCSRGQSDC